MPRRGGPTATGSRGGRSRHAPSGTSASRRCWSVPPTGWLLLVDEGPGETWLYLAEERAPDEVLAGFLGRRGRTDFARARRRSRLGGLASAGVFAGLVLIFYSAAFGLGPGGEVLGAVLAAASVVTLIRARPR